MQVDSAMLGEREHGEVNGLSRACTRGEYLMENVLSNGEPCRAGSGSLEKTVVNPRNTSQETLATAWEHMNNNRALPQALSPLPPVGSPSSQWGIVHLSQLC